MPPISQTPSVANIPETAWDAKTKVFLSYSRKDRAFAARLSDALEARDDIEVFRDTEDILPTEEWRVRLAKLIAEADTVVFCLSPDSATSEVCGWEVEQAEKINKRIAPVVVRDVDGKVPGGLAKLNYIFFTERDDFDRALDRLLLALNTDIGWIREHTRLGELSRRWSAGGTPKDQLLRGADIAAAEEWAARQPKTAPEPTGLARLFIAASRTNAVAEARRARRQKLMVGVLATAAAAIASLAYEGVLDQVFLKNQARKYADVHLQTVLKPEVERAL